MGNFFRAGYSKAHQGRNESKGRRQGKIKSSRKEDMYEKIRRLISYNRYFVLIVLRNSPMVTSENDMVT